MKSLTIIMAFFVTLIFVAIVLFLLIKIGESKFKVDVRTFFATSGSISHQTYHLDQLQGLPDPVQRYFKYVLKEGQSYVSYVRLQHEGQFKSAPDKDWMNIKGQQYFTLANPGFIWKGNTTWFTAYDRYVNSKGNLTVKLLSIVKIVDGKGPQIDEGELQRWLAENFWFPTNLLPNNRLRWESIDDLTARLVFEYKDLSLPMIIRFNELGELTSVECQRYMGEDDLEKWKGYASQYEEHNGMMIPTMIEAVWGLDSGDYSYAKFVITRIEYDKPVPF